MSSAERCTIWAFHPAGSTPALWEPLRRSAPELAFDTPDLNAIATRLAANAPYHCMIDALEELAPTGPLIVLGAGFGARLALSVAARLGDVVRAIYLAVPTPAVEDEAFLAKLAGLRSFMVEGFSEAQVQTLVPVMLFRWGLRYAEAARELESILRSGAGSAGAALGRLCLEFDDQPADWLHRISAPIDVIYGAADPVFEAREADSWRRQGIRSVQIVPGVSNQPPLEIPERLAADLRRIVAAI